MIHYGKELKTTVHPALISLGERNVLLIEKRTEMDICPKGLRTQSDLQGISLIDTLRISALEGKMCLTSWPEGFMSSAC